MSRGPLHRHYVAQGAGLLHNGFGRPTTTTLIFERGGEAWVPNTFNTAFTRMLRDAGCRIWGCTICGIRSRRSRSTLA
jgi:hypothetical protein